MNRTQQAISAALLTGTALGGGGVGYSAYQQNELDGFIANALEQNRTPVRPEQALRDKLARRGDKLLEWESRLVKAILKEGPEKHEEDYLILTERQKALQVETEKLYAQQIDAFKKEAERLHKELGIKAPLMVDVVTSTQTAMSAEFPPIGDDQQRVLRVAVSTSLLDSYTPKELSFALRHEMAGHGKHDGVTATDNVPPPKNLTRQQRMGLTDKQYEAFAREERADSIAVGMTCDPISAASAIAKLQKAKGYSIDRQEASPWRHLTQSVPNTLRTLLDVPRAEIGTGTDEGLVYSEWKQRIQKLRAEAAGQCPSSGKS